MSATWEKVRGGWPEGYFHPYAPKVVHRLVRRFCVCDVYRIGAGRWKVRVEASWQCSAEFRTKREAKRAGRNLMELLRKGWA